MWVKFTSQVFRHGPEGKEERKKGIKTQDVITYQKLLVNSFWTPDQ